MTDDRIEGNGVMTRLREETMDLHKETEHGDFQQNLLSGRLSTDAYADLLQQLLFVHRSLESTLRARMGSDPILSGVVHEEQFVEDRILEDLEHYGRSAASPETSAALPSAQAMTAMFAQLAAERPASLLGAHYVFEGSKNGGRFIARAMRGAYGLTGPGGLRYLEPYGEEQPHRWKAFKAAMEALPLNAADQDAIVEAAKETFRGIMELHRELHGRLPVAAGRGPRAE